MNANELHFYEYQIQIIMYIIKTEFVFRKQYIYKLFDLMQYQFEYVSQLYAYVAKTKLVQVVDVPKCWLKHVYYY